MTGVAGALAWGLSGVLTWAGAVKLRAPGRTARSFAALGLPRAPLLAVAVPVAELATAGLLLVVPRVGGALAVLLLAAFTAVLADRLRSGAAVACGCFGSASREPLTSAALLRNALLGGAALAVAVTAPARGLPPLPAGLVAAGLAVIGLVAVALWDLRARTGRLWDNRLETGPEGAA